MKKSKYFRVRCRRAGRFLMKSLRWTRSHLRWMKHLNPFRYLSRLDRYIMVKFIGTYIYSIALIISITCSR